MASSRRIKKRWCVKRQGRNERSHDNQLEVNWRRNERWQHVNMTVRGSVGSDRQHNNQPAHPEVAVHQEVVV